MFDQAPDQVLLAHATRWWEAEVENAKRHGTRMAGLLTVISAVLGFGLFNLANLHQLGLCPSAFFLRWMLAISLVYLFVALRAGLDGTGPRAQPSASSNLAMTEQNLPEGRGPLDLSASEASALSYMCVLAAAQDLQAQNTLKQGRIDRVQSWLCVAGVYAGLGILFFLPVPAIPEAKSQVSSLAQDPVSQATTNRSANEPTSTTAGDKPACPR